MIEIRYKCVCMTAEETIFVRNRRDKEDILNWMNIVQTAIGMSHLAISPFCMKTEVQYAKIPYSDNAPIGAQPTLN